MEFHKSSSAKGAVKKTTTNPTTSNRFFQLGESSDEEEEQSATKTTAAGKGSGKQDEEERFSRKKLNRLQEENRKLKNQLAELRDEMVTELAKADKKYRDLQEVVNGLVKERAQQQAERTKALTGAGNPGNPEKEAPTAKAAAAGDGPFYRVERDGNRGKKRRLTEVISVPGTPDIPKKEKPPRKATPAAPPRVDMKKIPPVILRKKENWKKVQKMMRDKKIDFENAKLISDGIAITPSTGEDHRKLTAALGKDQQEYHTYALPEDRPIRAVLRGIPEDIDESDIKEDLERQGVIVLSVHRMRSRSTKKLMPLVLVQVSRSQSNNDIDIFQVNRCCYLSVRVEAQRKPEKVTQCHRCQRFGHGQARCAAQPKCVKCGDNHASRDCKKPATEPARCANCRGPHPASYRGCPSFPKPRKSEVKGKERSRQYRPVTRQTSYADAAKANSEDEAEVDELSEDEQLEEMQEQQPEEQAEEITEMETSQAVDSEDDEFDLPLPKPGETEEEFAAKCVEVQKRFYAKQARDKEEKKKAKRERQANRKR